MWWMEGETDRWMQEISGSAGGCEAAYCTFPPVWETYSVTAAIGTIAFKMVKRSLSHKGTIVAEQHVFDGTMVQFQEWDLLLDMIPHPSCRKTASATHLKQDNQQNIKLGWLSWTAGGKGA